MDEAHKTTRERNKAARDARRAAREAEERQDKALVLDALRAVLKDPRPPRNSAFMPWPSWTICSITALSPTA